MRLRLGRWTRGCLLIVASVALVGCGGGVDGPKTIPATGAVTYKGEPVKNGSLVFSPADSKTSRAAQAEIVDGRYRTATGQGLMVGDYKVVVQALPPNIAEFEAKGGSKKATETSLVPKKYSDLKTTDLSLTVTDQEASITQDFELSD